MFGKYFAFNLSNNFEKRQFISSRIDINFDVKKMYEDELLKIDVSNMLGVYIRGTDYTNKKPSGHPVQPTLKQLMNKIDEFLDMYQDINGIFLVTEDKKLYLQLKQKYNSLIKISFEDNLIEQNKNQFLYKALKDKNKVDQGKKYLVKILLLSRCKYLVTSITNGSACALAFNGNRYKDKYIFELGLYV